MELCFLRRFLGCLWTWHFVKLSLLQVRVMTLSSRQLFFIFKVMMWSTNYSFVKQAHIWRRIKGCNRIGFCTVSRTYPIWCGQYILCVIRINGKECKVNRKEVPSYQIELTISIVQVINKCVLRKKWAKEWP